MSQLSASSQGSGTSVWRFRANFCRNRPYPQIPAQVGQQLLYLAVDAQGQQVVAQQLAHKELGGEVVQLPLPLGGGAVLGQAADEDEQSFIELMVVTLVRGAAKAGLSGLEELFF